MNRRTLIAVLAETSTAMSYEDEYMGMIGIAAIALIVLVVIRSRLIAGQQKPKNKGSIRRR